MEGPDDVQDAGWTSNLGDYLEESLAAERVEGLRKVYKGYENWLPLFPAFPLQLFDGKNILMVDLFPRNPHCDSG